MYNFSFRHHNLDYAYMAFDIKEDQVPAALDAIRLFKMRGANVTMPCKNEVAKHMDELSPAARIIGAVNTIVNEDGKLVGHITDGIGFVRNLKEHGVDVKGKKMVVLGAGGAATAIQVQCALDGAESISIFNPKDPFFARAESTAEKLSKETPDCKVSVFDLADEAKLKEEVANADILVNATLAGMKPHEELTLIKDKSMFRPDLVVADVVYNPAETRMVKEAKEAGCKLAIGGKGMLLWELQLTNSTQDWKCQQLNTRNSRKKTKTSNNNLGDQNETENKQNAHFHLPCSIFHLFHPWNRCFYPGAVQTGVCSCLGCEAPG